MQSNSEAPRANPPPNGGPIRLNSVKGYGNRTNNIIYCPPLLRTTNNNNKDDENTALVYFGGDVQDIPEVMEDNRDTKGYVKWNLDNTAVILRESFPRSHILIIRPARMEFTTFSCFDNFVRGNNVGIPDHTPMHYSLQHLEEILKNVTKKLKTMCDPMLVCKLLEASSGQAPETNQEMEIDILQVQDNVSTEADKVLEMGFSCKDDAIPTIPIPADLTPDLLQADSPLSTNPTITTPSSNPRDPHDLLWWRDSINLDKAHLSILGFSKGCVVLNQFIYEFHYLKTLTPDDSSMMRLVSRIKNLYWLDGGHGGGKNTWITSRSLLETLCRLGINIHLHVTPYQVQDDHRPWIRKEEKAFTDLLKRLGCTLTRHLHVSESNVSNLFTHFEVLENFRKHQINMQQQQPETNSQVIQKTPHLGALDNCSKKSSSSSSSSSDGSNNEDELEKPEIK